MRDEPLDADVVTEGPERPGIAARSDRDDDVDGLAGESVEDRAKHPDLLVELRAHRHVDERP